MTITPTTYWTRAMERAAAHGLKPCRRVDGNYRVPSASQPGEYHTVTVRDGKITGCNCVGYRGRQRPCWPAGAVALGIAWMRGDSIVRSRGEEVAA